MSEMIERIEREVGVPGLVSLLSERLSPSDLQSLMLEIYRHRAAQREPAHLLSDYESNRFVCPSEIDPHPLLEWEKIAYESLPPEFEGMILSPVCPLGTSSTIAPITQDWALATSRNTEVVSDSTNVMALECALRRRALLTDNPKSTEAIHLAAAHRLLRTIKFDDPHSYSHFSVFSLCSAGRDRGDLKFELQALRLHIHFYVNALQAFLGEDLPLILRITDFGSGDRTSLLDSEILIPTQDQFLDVRCEFNNERTSGRGYYDEICFHIDATTASGEILNVADGGVVDWTQQLLSNKKERLVISGIGSDRVCTAF